MSKQQSALLRFVSSSLVVVGVGGQFVVSQSYQWGSEYEVEQHNAHPTINGSGQEVALNTECKGELTDTNSQAIDNCMSKMYYRKPYPWEHQKITFDAEKKTVTKTWYKDDKCEEVCSEADTPSDDWDTSVLYCSDQTTSDPYKCIDNQGLAHVVVNVYQDADCKDEDVVMKNYKLPAYECRNDGYFSSYEGPSWKWTSSSATITDGVYETKSFSDKDCKTLSESNADYALKFETSGCVKVNEQAFSFKSTKMYIKVLSSQETDSGFKTGLAPLAAIVAAWIVL